MSILLRRGVISSGLSGVPLLTYNHTWVSDADIQSNQADFDGTDDKVTFPDDPLFDFEGNDFTIEAILNWDSIAGDSFPQIMAKWSNGSTKGWAFYYSNPSTALEMVYTTNGSSVSAATGATFTPTLEQEYHVALCRNGADLRFFIDGVQSGSTADISTDVFFANSELITIGGYAPTNGDMNGQINYLKVSDIALYTANFTAPSTLSNDENTSYLNSFEGANGSTPTLNTD